MKATLKLEQPNTLRSLLFQTNVFSEDIELSPEIWMETNVVVYSVQQISIAWCITT